MAVTVTGSNSIAGTSVTIPTHAVGNLIVIFAYNNASNTPATKPAAAGTVPAWVTLSGQTGGQTNSGFIAWFIATATNHTSGTWTNATGMAVAVLTGHDPVTPMGTVSGQVASTSATTATAATSSVGISKTDGSSAILSFIGHRTVTSWTSVTAGFTIQTSAATQVLLATKDTPTAGVACIATLTSSGSSGFWGYQLEVVAPSARLAHTSVAGAQTLEATAQAAADNVAIPTHAIGDLLVVWAYRDGSTTTPTMPAAAGTVPAWVDIDNPTGGNSNSARSAYFIATATNHTTGSWTNATGISVVVLRGHDPSQPIGGHAVANATSTNTVTAPALTLANSVGTSCLLHFYGHQNVTAWSGANASYVRRGTVNTELIVNNKSVTTSDGSVANGNTATSGGSYGQSIEVLALITRASATLVGQGVLSATVKVNESATLAGQGVLSATITPKITATLAGPGVLSATASAKASRTATLAGPGVLSATASAKPSRSATLAGSGALSATAHATKFVLTATLAGHGATSGLDLQLAARSTAPAGAGTLVAAAQGQYSMSSGVAASLPLVARVRYLRNLQS